VETALLLWHDRHVKRLSYIIVVCAAVATTACQGNARYASGVNAMLFTNLTNSVMPMPLTVQGSVGCPSCSPNEGMAVVVSSLLNGVVADQYYNTVGNYSLGARVKSGDVLNVQISVMTPNGPVMRTAVITVPSDSVIIQQDFEF